MFRLTKITSIWWPFGSGRGGETPAEPDDGRRRFAGVDGRLYRHTHTESQSRRSVLPNDDYRRRA